jgi:hypothetical protein
MMGGDPGREASLRVLDQRPFDVDAGFLPEIFKIDATDDLPHGMVRVPGWRINDDGQTLEVQDFFIGRFEVTNAEFQKFVDAGGYDNSDYWADEFEMNGQIVGWDEAIALMVDKSGRQGPSTWMGGAFPAGQANHPVAGVSWYEADAFARFANAELPTYSHWRRAIANGALPWMIPASNLDGTGTADVGSFSGIGWAGAYDLAGNVREWTSSSNDGRVILGGAWNDPPYVVLESMLDASALPPFDRSETNGFRLAITSDDPRVANVLLAPVTINRESLDAEPVSDDIYEIFKNLFRYDNAAPLTARTEIEEMRGRWVREYVTFDAPYDDDRIGLYLYFPEFTSKPLQTVIFWGGASWLFVDSIDRFNAPPLEFLLQSGRAVAVPVLAGTFQRRNAARVPWSTIAGRDLAIHQVRDLRRVVDYLQTRADIDAEALGYYGKSWGGRLGGIVLAVEDRIKVGVLDQAGLQHLWHPETSVVNYLPHVNTPVLQFNGVYDTDFRFETSAVPFFELLGTPLEHKKHVTGPSSHFTPRPVVIGETLNWLDKYFGQAR